MTHYTIAVDGFCICFHAEFYLVKLPSFRCKVSMKTWTDTDPQTDFARKPQAYIIRLNKDIAEEVLFTTIVTQSRQLHPDRYISFVTWNVLKLTRMHLLFANIK